jgi:hypothetical protein
MGVCGSKCGRLQEATKRVREKDVGAATGVHEVLVRNVEKATSTGGAKRFLGSSRVRKGSVRRSCCCGMNDASITRKPTKRDVKSEGGGGGLQRSAAF